MGDFEARLLVIRMRVVENVRSKGVARRRGASLVNSIDPCCDSCGRVFYFLETVYISRVMSALIGWFDSHTNGWLPSGAIKLLVVPIVIVK